MEGEPYTDFHPNCKVWGTCSKCKDPSPFYEEGDAIHYVDPGDENDSFE